MSINKGSGLRTRIYRRRPLSRRAINKELGVYAQASKSKSDTNHETKLSNEDDGLYQGETEQEYWDTEC
ncbi:MAG: hypothetical protein GX207_09065 [Peptococcaceae bacterium]|nr:hypothetical protein [Peptococcaceae bacterium]